MSKRLRFSSEFNCSLLLVGYKPVACKSFTSRLLRLINQITLPSDLENMVLAFLMGTVLMFFLVSLDFSYIPVFFSSKRCYFLKARVFQLRKSFSHKIQ